MTAAELAEQLELMTYGVGAQTPDGTFPLPDKMPTFAPAALLRQAAARLRSMEEALTETLEVAARHRRVALDYKYGTKADEKLPTDREWDATRDRVAAALSGEGQ